MIDELEGARDLVLVDNTAQAVFKHLDRIEDSRTTLGRRWIWELLQNARDSAGPDGVRIHVRLSESELCFEHDGKAFVSEEIAHLVYHGSTKIEDFESIGQFGSGFLSTHLLSRLVRVGGCLSEARTFAFALDRAGDTVEKLRVAMDESWRAFMRSVQDGASSQPPNVTHFAYEIGQPGHELAQEGLSDLLRCGPQVLAFCPEITSIEVETVDDEWSLQRGERTRFEGGHILSIRHRENDHTLNRWVAVAESAGELCAAVRLCPTDSGMKVDEAQDLAPKLFVLFPLIGSERLGLPVAINSRRFKPREDRDGIVLVGDSTGARGNRELLGESIELQERLLEWCGKEQWNGVEGLLAFDTTNLPDWADAEDQGWLRELLTTLIARARSTPLFLTVGGEWIEPQSAWLPVMDDSAHRERLWDLMSMWTDAPSRLPRRDDLNLWSRNLKGWAELLDRSPGQMEEALTGARVAQLVSRAGKVESLQEQLTSGDGLRWLTSFLRLLQDAGHAGLFDEHEVLPSQAGRLRRRAELRRDEGISHELKDIAEAFDVDIRGELLNGGAELAGIARLLAAEREPELLDRVLERLDDECGDETIDASLVPWVTRLFWWMVETNHLERLDGFPIPTAHGVGEEIGVLCLELEREARERPMAPVVVWPERARGFSSLFPKQRILAEALATGRDRDQWGPLVGRGLVNPSPLIEVERVMDVFLPDEPLPEVDGADSHKSTEDVEVSDLAFLNAQDTGLIDTARKSRRRATDLVRFLLEFVTETDTRAFERVGVACECEQEHSIYRGAWLVPLARRRWVPLDAGGRRAAAASAASLAKLLTEAPDVAERLCGEAGEGLMSALKISRADLALRVVAPDEQTRVALIRAMGDLAEAAHGDLGRVRELATEIREHPEIIESIEEQRVRRGKIQRNHDIGKLVEELLRAELEARGLTVRRTGRGSDFEVESDYVEDGEELWLELVDEGASTLIEVKSTRADHVRMTPVQVEEACRLGERFALCAVEIDDDAPTREAVRKGCRVVFGIGRQLAPALTGYRGFREVGEAARRGYGGVALEFGDGQVRFGIGESIWRAGLMFEQACERFGRRG